MSSENQHSETVSNACHIGSGPPPPLHVTVLALEARLMEQPPPGTLLVTTAERNKSHRGAPVSHSMLSPEGTQLTGQKGSHGTIRP